MRMKFVKNNGGDLRTLSTPDGSKVVLKPGAQVENIDVLEVPDGCTSSVELSEIRRKSNTNLLHD